MTLQPTTMRPPETDDAQRPDCDRPGWVPETPPLPDDLARLVTQDMP